MQKVLNLVNAKIKKAHTNFWEIVKSVTFFNLSSVCIA
jgi:hypothetical protein